MIMYSNFEGVFILWVGGALIVAAMAFGYWLGATSHVPTVKR
jgi:hypothetical protein